jgi:hypothetical protein
VRFIAALTEGTATGDAGSRGKTGGFETKGSKMLNNSSKELKTYSGDALGKLIRCELINNHGILPLQIDAHEAYANDSHVAVIIDLGKNKAVATSISKERICFDGIPVTVKKIVLAIPK